MTDDALYEDLTLTKQKTDASQDIAKPIIEQKKPAGPSSPADFQPPTFEESLART